MKKENISIERICIWIHQIMWVIGTFLCAYGVILVFGIEYGNVEDLTIFDCASVFTLGLVACMYAKQHMPKDGEEDGEREKTE